MDGDAAATGGAEIGGCGGGGVIARGKFYRLSLFINFIL